MGELLIKGPNVMKGYRDNADANEQVFLDGWLRTGDMAEIDEFGSVTISDRLKELIKVIIISSGLKKSKFSLL